MSIVESAAFAIREMYNQGKFYLYGNAIVEVVEDDDSGMMCLRPLAQADLKWHLRRMRSEGEQTLKAIAEDILHNPKLPFSRIRSLVRTPTFREDLSLITTPGFDSESGIYYAPDRELRQYKFRTDATHADALEAFTLLHELLTDFPFTSEVDKWSYWSALLTLFLRSALYDIVPALCLDGNDRSVGKGLLSSMLSLIPFGEECPSMSVPANKSEWNSKLDAIVVSGAPLQVIDNVVGKFANEEFASLLTAMRRSVRIKGKTEIRTLPHVTFWVVNGNEIQVDSDMSERLIRCRLQHPDARSRRQDAFHIQKKYDCSIPTLLRQRRAKYMQACLSIICAWANSGKAKRHSNVQMAKYGEWESLLGGIFDWLHPRKPRLLSTHREHTTAVDTEREEAIAFIAALINTFPSCDEVGITVSDITSKVFSKDAFGRNNSKLRNLVPGHLLKKEEGIPFATALGRWLNNASTRKWGPYKITVEKDWHLKVAVYKIESIDNRHSGNADHEDAA